MSFETPWYKLTETYLKTWDYKIWKQKWFNNICNVDKWCFNWKMLWLKQDWNDIFIYININYEKGIVGYEKNKKYYYNYFKKENHITIYNLNDLPKYWILSNNNLEFYSENDLENLSKEQQYIFNKLEEKPEIIINGIDYTK